MTNTKEQIKASKLDPNIWGPHYWFVLHTIAYCYPSFPNDVVKRKYYDFIQTLPLLIPHPPSSKEISQYIDDFSVTPYLDSRKSFMIYINRMHNYMNKRLDKPVFDNITDSTEEYLKLYEREQPDYESKKNMKKYIVLGGCGILLLTIIILLLLG